MPKYVLKIHGDRFVESGYYRCEYIDQGEIYIAVGDVVCPLTKKYASERTAKSAAKRICEKFGLLEDIEIEEVEN